MEKVTSADGTTLALDACGSGPPLVIVGGAFHDRRVAPAVAEVLAARFTVVRYDRRGRGSSGGEVCRDDPAAAIADEVADLAAVLALVGPEAPVYGLTTGGVLALRAAAAGVPVGPVVVADVPFRTSQHPPRQVVPTLVHLIDSRRYDAAAAYFLSAGLAVRPRAVEHLRQAPVWPLLQDLAPTLLADAALLGDLRVPSALLRRVATPVLALAGVDGPTPHADAARATAGAVRSGRWAVLDGPDACPAAVAGIVGDFVAHAAQ